MKSKLVAAGIALGLGIGASQAGAQTAEEIKYGFEQERKERTAYWDYVRKGCVRAVVDSARHEVPFSSYVYRFDTAISPDGTRIKIALPETYTLRFAVRYFKDGSGNARKMQVDYVDWDERNPSNDELSITLTGMEEDDFQHAKHAIGKWMQMAHPDSSSKDFDLILIAAEQLRKPYAFDFDFERAKMPEQKKQEILKEEREKHPANRK